MSDFPLFLVERLVDWSIDIDVYRQLDELFRICRQVLLVKHLDSWMSSLKVDDAIYSGQPDASLSEWLQSRLSMPLHELSERLEAPLRLDCFFSLPPFQALSNHGDLILKIRSVVVEMRSLVSKQHVLIHIKIEGVGILEGAIKVNDRVDWYWRLRNGGFERLDIVQPSWRRLTLKIWHIIADVGFLRRHDE